MIDGRRSTLSAVAGEGRCGVQAAHAHACGTSTITFAWPRPPVATSTRANYQWACSARDQPKLNGCSTVVRSLRPRRAYCRVCETTHVLLPAWSVPRRRDGAEVIGAALLDKDPRKRPRGVGRKQLARNTPPSATGTSTGSPCNDISLMPPRSLGKIERRQPSSASRLVDVVPLWQVAVPRVTRRGLRARGRGPTSRRNR